jgi:hypothetical protein
MITDEEILNLKAGDKLIFWRNGQVLSANKGNVFTFSNWNDPDLRYRIAEKRYFQTKELLDYGNIDHGLYIFDCEFFNEEIHKDFRIMDYQELQSDLQKFIKQYGK